MKLRYLSFLTAALLVLAGCTKDAKMWERAKVNEVKMLSFGFYKDDNPNTLLKDYVVNLVKSNSIDILLPASIDKSSLVARFTTSDNDVIRVKGVAQKSGETVNDFTVPVDYILTDGDYNAKYTVTIRKGADYIWTSIPFTVNDSATDMSMKLNPASGEPVMVFTTNRSSTSDSRLAMVSFENDGWVENGIISDGRAANFDFTFNSAGIPFVSYSDYTTTPSTQRNTVKTLQGGSWSLVGALGFTPAKITYNAISFDEQNRLQTYAMVDAAGGPFARRELSVNTFENGAWVSSKIPSRPTTVPSYLPVAVLRNNAVYLGVYNAVTPNSFSLYKWKNGGWTALLEAYITTGQTAGNIYDFDIDADNEGNVYIATVDNSDGGVNKLHVLKYNETTQAVTTVGSYLTAAVGSSAQFDLALSPIGTPYLLYRNNTSYPTVVYFDDETQDWSTPHLLANEAADCLMLDFVSNGEAFAAYVKAKKMFVHKYSAP